MNTDDDDNDAGAAFDRAAARAARREDRPDYFKRSKRAPLPIRRRPLRPRSLPAAGTHCCRSGRHPLAHRSSCTHCHFGQPGCHQVVGTPAGSHTTDALTAGEHKQTAVNVQGRCGGAHLAPSEAVSTMTEMPSISQRSSKWGSLVARLVAACRAASTAMQSAILTAQRLRW
jgi:hypothetical protein